MLKPTIVAFSIFTGCVLFFCRCQPNNPVISPRTVDSVFVYDTIYVRGSTSAADTATTLDTVKTGDAIKIIHTIKVLDSTTALARIDASQRHQTIEGFGGGFMYGVWPYGRPVKNELYDSIFNGAGCNVVRIMNSWEPKKDSAVDEIPMMKEVQALYPQVKVFMASWSPPKYLKAMDTVAGRIGDKFLSLKKVDGRFLYDEYADYWYASIRHFQDNGLKISWASIQNEPDWPAYWEGCYLIPTETDSFASYGKALDAVYRKVQSLGVPLIGPDVTGPIGNILPETGIHNSLDLYLRNLNPDQLYAVCHHFYNGQSPEDMRQVRTLYPGRSIYQTEWLTNDTIPLWTGGPLLTWYDHMQVIQNALTCEDISMYLLFALAYKPLSTHCFFSLDSTAPGGYTTRPIYYAFKHFSRSIHRGWKRVDAAAANGPALSLSAFANDKNDSMAVVVINTGARTMLRLKNVPEGIDTGAVFETSRSGSAGALQSRKYELIARLGKTPPAIPLDACSITTFDLWKAAGK
jgi:glucuronoarabinoxylan endo-1,4-beta-xylanase